MPELPEVETVRRVLEPQLCGRRVDELVVNRPDVIAHPSADVFRDSVTSSTIRCLKRRGKFLKMFLDNGSQIVVHLRMTGQLLVTPPGFPLMPHTHLVFRLDNGNELRFTDVRRFGRMWLIANDEDDGISGIERLGPEPLEEGFDSHHLEKSLAKRHISVKQGLLDQGVVAGIGNIYSDEILFEANINPGRQTSDLKNVEWETLTKAIIKVLEEAIANNSVSAEEYLASGGREYRNNPNFKVYGREGEVCPRCGTTIERTKIAGRSSFCCPRCQPHLTS